MDNMLLKSTLARSESTLSRRAQERLLLGGIMFGDALSLLFAFSIAYFIRFELQFTFFEDVVPSVDLHRWIILGMIPVWIAIFAFFHLYDLNYLLGGTEEYSRVFTSCAVALSIIVLASFFIPVVRLSRGWIAVGCTLAFFCLIFDRFMFRRIAYQMRNRGMLMYRTLIVGTDEEAIAIADQLAHAPTAGAHIVGFVSNTAPSEQTIALDPPIVGSVEQLSTLVKSFGIEELIVSPANLPRSSLLEIFENFGSSDDVELRFSSGLYETYTAGVRVKEISNVPLVSMNKVRLNRSEEAIKLVSDFFMASMALLILFPVYLVIAILIKLDSRGPIFYRRRVMGRGNTQFDAFKFRTMFVNGDEILQRDAELAQQFKTSFKLKDDPRVTPIGRWLRRMSLDELPQLFNVLLGQMSLVGPRMITAEEGPKYGKMKMNLLTVKPGLTGLWQIKGRSDVSYEERVRLDMYYIRNYSIWLDVQILFQTIPAVLKGRGAY